MLENLEKRPLDPIFKVFEEFLTDKNPQKVNLGIGLYADEMGNAFVFPSIKKAFSEVDTEDFNYQPIGGNREYLELTAELALESGNLENLAMMATCGGTQACKIFAEIVKKAYGPRPILIGVPTWGNHFAVFAGLEHVRFEHVDADGKADYSSYKSAIEEAEAGSILLLQGGLTHNPTGRNISLEELNLLIPLLNEKAMMLYVDSAYLGFGEGLTEDREYLRLCYEGLEHFAFGFSYSKNASLYEHRTGALFVKTQEVAAVESQMQQVARESISMAPGIGQEIMINILKNYRSEWEAEVEEVRQSIENRKNKLVDALGIDFEYLRECKGMFGMMQLSEAEIMRLRKENSVYLCDNGRINFAGITEGTVAYIAEAVKRG